MEVIVVDNASGDGSAAMVRAEFPDVLLRAESRNTGFAHGNNLGYIGSRGEYVLVLNPDTEMRPGTLEGVCRILDDNPQLGAVAVRQIGVKGDTQRSVRGFPTPWNLFGEGYWLRRFNYDRAGPAPQPMATFLLLRREAVEAAGGLFDERFPIFFNDVDFCRRLWDAGWPIRYEPSLSILHHGGEGTRQVRRAMIWESHKSLLRYWRKHPGGTWGAKMGTWLLLPALALAIYGAAWWRAKGYDAGFRA